jgi:hypothetical protein
MHFTCITYLAALLALSLTTICLCNKIKIKHRYPVRVAVEMADGRHGIVTHLAWSRFTKEEYRSILYPQIPSWSSYTIQGAYTYQASIAQMRN